MKTERLRVSFDVEIKYEKPAGREYLIERIHSLLVNENIRRRGYWAIVGNYAMKSIPGTIDVKPLKSPIQAEPPIA